MAPAGPVASQELTIERLTALCRPQLEALDREEGIPFLQGEVDRGREYLAEAGQDADPDSVDELRRFEAQLADIRANGVNAAETREWIGYVLQYDEAELRHALVRRDMTDLAAAAERCLAEARLADSAGVSGQKTP